MLAQKTVEHIAKLARLGLSPLEIKKYQKELSAILGYVEKLKKADVSEIKPTSHPLKVENVERKDEAKTEKRKLFNGFLKVKSILK